MFFFRQQHMVFHIEDARGVVGAFEMHAKAREPVGVVAQHGAVGRAVEAQRGLLHETQEARQFLARLGAFGQTSCNSIQAELMVSHISLVSAVRTEREFSRAASMQFLIEEGLLASNDRKSMTFWSLASV